MKAAWPSPVEIARLRAAIVAMPEPRRSVYLLCARERLDYNAVAGRLGLTVREVERHLAEALVDLMAAADEDGEPTPSLQ
ncbi:hypothetical protein GCM10009087_18570 [Sphingomonas oligophenolica]|uniref:Sigma factor-like helix-turn-helix DNA-binding protein n=1 Tax=Sphingomonas oligophenolica TaxID=301154 RepID=A0ABU9Y3C1_9SPHN